MRTAAVCIAICLGLMIPAQQASAQDKCKLPIESLQPITLNEALARAGKNYQKIQSEYKSLQGEVRDLEAQLRLLKLDPAKIKSGTLYERVPIVAPIGGYIDRIEAKIG